MSGQFEILTDIRDISVIAAGRGVKTREALNKKFGKG